jgi:L-ascorbate metabolism protein UlaG (beta-lactamase superfamily)
MTKELVTNIHWLGHSSFRVEGDGLVIYIDPWQLKNGPKADIILITHDHRDHRSPEDIAKIRKEDTIIVTTEKAAEGLKGQVEIVKSGDSLTVKSIPIEVVPAYNVNKFRSPGTPYHPKESGHVGFIFTMEGHRIYHTGDADPIPEMETIQADIVMLPVSGTYVMTVEEAIDVAQKIKPQVAIPMHMGRSIGSMEDARRFKDGSAIPVEILPLEE